MATQLMDPSHTIWCGTEEGSTLWWSSGDYFGLICAPIVLMVFVAAGIIVTVFYNEDYFSFAEAAVLFVLLVLAVWSHLKVMFSNPGAVPKLAKPISRDRSQPHVMCGRCDAYKPPMSHHGESCCFSLTLFRQ
jgi:palmitoyltransferase ZDHHC3/7/25